MALLVGTWFGSPGKGGSVGNEDCVYSFLTMRNVLALIFSVTVSELKLMVLLLP